MKIHAFVQGSPEWKAFRATSKNASEASSMMGVGLKQRDKLVMLKATGTQEEFTEWVQANKLDKGHEYEGIARPFAEKLIGSRLYPITASSDDYPELSASFDGCTVMEDVNWEHKSPNKEKQAFMREHRMVPEADFWQVVQQFLVNTNAQRCLYTVGDGTEANTDYVWVERADIEPRFPELLAGWDHLDTDIAAYKPAAVEAEVVAKVVNLPAITYRTEEGGKLITNIEVYSGAVALALEEAKKPLVTDQDFADRKQLNKSFRDALERITVVRDMALSETKDFADFAKKLDDLHETIRQAALAGEKLVEKREKEIKQELKDAAIKRYNDYRAKVEEGLNGRVKLPIPPENFAGVMKNKRSFSSMENALNTEVARLKIEVDMLLVKIRTNLALVDKHPDHAFLFANDLQALVGHESEMLQMIIDKRIRDYTDEQKRREEEAAAAERASQEADHPAITVDAAAPSRTEVRTVNAAYSSNGQGFVGTALREARQEVADPAYVEVLKSDLLRLREDSATLKKLYDGGVENWDGYARALGLEGVSEEPAKNDDLHYLDFDSENHVLIYDTETSGIPDYQSPSESEHQPHIVEIAGLLFTKQGKLVDYFTTLVKPEGWTTGPVEVHGITQEMAEADGIPEAQALGRFLDFQARCGLRIAHNRSFDDRIIRIAMFRYVGEAAANTLKENTKGDCTMYTMKSVMKVKKLPKLSEAYKFVTGRELVEAHRALADALACAEVYFGNQGITIDTNGVIPKIEV